MNVSGETIPSFPPARKAGSPGVSPCNPDVVVLALQGASVSGEVWGWLMSLADLAVTITHVPSYLKEDYRQEALISAVEVAPKWDSGVGVSFRSFLLSHMRWGIQRRMRERDQVPESVRRDLKTIRDAKERLVAEGLPVDDDSVASRSGLPLRRIRSLHFWSQEALDLAARQMFDLYQMASFESQMSQVESALNELPPREKKLLSRRFLDNASVTEISHEFNISTSRVSQLVRRALSQVRDSVLHSTENVQGGP